MPLISSSDRTYSLRYRGRRCCVVADPWGDGRFCVVQFQDGQLAQVAVAQLEDIRELPCYCGDDLAGAYTPACPRHGP